MDKPSVTPVPNGHTGVPVFRPDRTIRQALRTTVNRESQAPNCIISVPGNTDLPPDAFASPGCGSETDHFDLIDKSRYHHLYPQHLFRCGVSVSTGRTTGSARAGHTFEESAHSEIRRMPPGTTAHRPSCALVIGQRRNRRRIKAHTNGREARSASRSECASGRIQGANRPANPQTGTAKPASRPIRAHPRHRHRAGHRSTLVRPRTTNGKPGKAERRPIGIRSGHASRNQVTDGLRSRSRH